MWATDEATGLDREPLAGIGLAPVPLATVAQGVIWLPEDSELRAASCQVKVGGNRQDFCLRHGSPAGQLGRCRGAAMARCPNQHDVAMRDGWNRITSDHAFKASGNRCAWL